MMASNKFRIIINKDTGKPEIENLPIPNENTSKFVGQIVASESGVQFKTDEFSNVDKVVDSFAKNLTVAGFKQKDKISLIEQLKVVTNTVIEACKKSVELCGEIDKKDVFYNALNRVNDHFNKKIGKCDTIYKIKNEITQNPLFVPPQEKSIGTKWRTKLDSDSELPNHEIIPATFQYVPIGNTVKSLFMQPEFRELFFEYLQ